MRPNGLDRIKGRPPVVHRAVLTGDVAYLSVAGKKGAEVLKEKRADNAAEAEYYREKLAEQEANRAQQANEHIVPIDSSDEKEVA